MGSVKPRHLGPIALGCLLSQASIAHAQGISYRWIQPNGGSYQDAQNWTPEGVPKEGDTGVFDLLSAYTVSNDLGKIVGEIGNVSITRSDVEFEILGSGQSPLDIGAVTIGGTESTIAFPGRFTAVDSSTNPLGLGFLARRLEVGGDYRASKFSSSPGTSFQVDSRVSLRANATLEFLLGAESDPPFRPRLSILGNDKRPSDLAGTLDIGADKLELPPIGSTTRLLEGDIGFWTEDGYPSLELVVLRPTRGRSIEVLASLPFLGQVSIDSKIDFAESISSIDLTDESSLGAPPTGLAAADLSGDGRDDLIVLLADGTLRIYPSITGGFDLPVDFAVGEDPRDVSTGDFDDDGTIDLAVVCDGDDSLRFLLNPSGDPASLVTGPTEILDDSPVGSATTTFLINPLGRAAARGVSVTTKGSSGGKVAAYRLNAGSVTKLGTNTDVGDDPGTTDPIDDEGKKDDTAPVGVGGLGSTPSFFGEIEVPVLFILEITATGAGYPYELTDQIPLSGYPIDFVSRDIDKDGVTETFVLTDAGQLDLLEVGVSIRRTIGSFDLQGKPTALAIAQLEGDGGIDDPFELVIGFDAPPRIDVYRVGRSFATEGFAGGGFLTGRYVFERILSRDLQDTPVGVVASDALVTGETGEVYLGTTGGGGSSINIGDYTAEATPSCVYADLDQNGFVQGFDLAIMLGSWGECDDCIADINGDGIVDAADIGLLFIAWGPCGS